MNEAPKPIVYISKCLGFAHCRYDGQMIESSFYEEHLKLALTKPPRFQSVINVLQHAFGGFSKQLSSEEKQFFLESLEEYRDERILLSAVLHVLRAWAIQYQNSYLLNQSFMNPYPKQLVEITDSGKGRKL